MSDIFEQIGKICNPHRMPGNLERCPYCHGTGVDHSPNYPVCVECGGTGIWQLDNVPEIEKRINEDDERCEGER